MLLLVLAILLPCTGLIAAPGLISSNVKGPILLAPGATVIVPLAGVVQLAVTVGVNVGAVAAPIVTVLVTRVPQASVIRTVYAPGGRLAKVLSVCGALITGDGGINSSI